MAFWHPIFKLKKWGGEMANEAVNEEFHSAKIRLSESQHCSNLYMLRRQKTLWFIQIQINQNMSFKRITLSFMMCTLWFFVFCLLLCLLWYSHAYFQQRFHTASSNLIQGGFRKLGLRRRTNLQIRDVFMTHSATIMESFYENS